MKGGPESDSSNPIITRPNREIRIVLKDVLEGREGEVVDVVHERVANVIGGP